MRSIVVGDIHGCLDELKELLKKVEYKRGRDRLVFAGDLLDRGPDPLGVVRFAREHRVICVKGNHEDNHERFREQEFLAATKHGYRNPLTMRSPKRKAQHESLTPDDWDFIARFPLIYRLDENWVVLHGGLEPGIPLSRQDPAVLLTCRYINKKTHKMMSMREEEEQPALADHWGVRWRGPESIIYGHQVFIDGPHMTNLMVAPPGQRPRKVLTVGIDTGCCFGFKLTAALVDSRGPYEYVSVAAKETYAKLFLPRE